MKVQVALHGMRRVSAVVTVDVPAGGDATNEALREASKGKVEWETDPEYDVDRISAEVIEE